MRIEDYIGSLPQGIITGDDVQLPASSFREIFGLAGVGGGDVLYHLGCGDGAGLEVALNAFGAGRAVGIDCDPEKISAAAGRGLEGASLVCDDVRNQEFGDATVVLSWFADEGVASYIGGRIREMPPGRRIVTILEPLPGCRPDAVRFPYLLHRTPLTRAADPREQVLAIFGSGCIDFVTAWEHAERYAKAVTGPGFRNDRFLTIMQSVIIWINARNLGVACGEGVPESVRTYISILREFFGIEVEHLIRGGGGGA